MSKIKIIEQYIISKFILKLTYTKLNSISQLKCINSIDKYIF